MDIPTFESAFEAPEPGAVIPTEEQLRELEWQLGGPIPETLRRWWLTYGAPQLDYAYERLVHADEELPLDVFHPPLGERGVLAVLADYDELRERNLVPFAHDFFGDQHAFSTEDGSIWFNDREYGGGLSRIAPDFDSYLGLVTMTKHDDE